MSQAKSFPIIDVLARPPTPEVATTSERPNEDEGKRERASLAVWSSPSQDGALVLRDGSSPTIGLEYLTLPEVLDGRLVMLREPGSAQARSYRLLRHRLLSQGDPRVVAVTSARPGEGKTTCALNLAFALAEDTMMRVLLLEANLRRPALWQVLGFEPAESLVEHITRFTDVGPPYPVAAISGTRLHVAALPESPLPEARLDRTLFSVALFDLRNAYDYIVIDAGSVLESADADVIGECSNGVVMTVRAGSSRARDLRRAIDQLAPTAILGTVLLDT
jgi:Mrp family chromosome partitioning ATPase